MSDLLPACPRYLCFAIRCALVASGNPFHGHESGEIKRPIVLTVDQRRALVAGLAALETRLAGPDAEQAVASFRKYALRRMRGEPEWLAALREKDLMCYCPLDAPCHADVLLELANPPLP